MTWTLSGAWWFFQISDWIRTPRPSGKWGTDLVLWLIFCTCTWIMSMRIAASFSIWKIASSNLTCTLLRPLRPHIRRAKVMWLALLRKVVPDFAEWRSWLTYLHLFASICWMIQEISQDIKRALLLGLVWPCLPCVFFFFLIDSRMIIDIFKSLDKLKCLSRIQVVLESMDSIPT